MNKKLFFTNSMISKRSRRTKQKEQLSKQKEHVITKLCLLNNLKCCWHCTDKRPHSKYYYRYIDGEGNSDNCSREIYYCFNCALNKSCVYTSYKNDNQLIHQKTYKHVINDIECMPPYNLLPFGGICYQKSMEHFHSTIKLKCK